MGGSLIQRVPPNVKEGFTVSKLILKLERTEAVVSKN
jgi:hypothetical protein